MEGALRALVHRTIKVVLVLTRRIGCFPGPLLFGLEECVKALLVSCPLATSPLHSRGSPTKGTKSKWAHKWAKMLHHPCILGGPQQRGQNQSGPTSGRKCYITPAFSGVPTKGTKSKWAHKWAEMLHHPCILGGPQQRGQNQSGPTSGRKCYITPAFSGVPKEMGTKSELAGPTSRQKCYITPAFSGVPNKGDKIKVGPQVGGNATSPLHSRGSPKKWGQNQNWRGPQVGKNATSPLHSRGSPTKGTKSKWAHKWAEMLHHPCILGDPQRKGDKIRIGCLTAAFWEAHKWAEMLHQPCILGDP